MLKSARKKKRFTKNDFLVDEITHKLGKKLMRNLLWQESSGTSSGKYWIYDPVFKSVQRDSHWKDKGRFTSGFYIDLSDRRPKVGFRTEHIRTQIDTLVSNSDDGLLFWKVLKIAMNYSYSFKWSSKSVAKDSGKKDHTKYFCNQRFPDFKRFLKEWLGSDRPESFARDIGADMPITYKKAEDFGKVRKGSPRGTLFWLEMEASNRSCNSISSKLNIVIPLFLALYPISTTVFRRSGFRPKLERAYKRMGLGFECGFVGCRVAGIDYLEASHIMPASMGGTDDIDNGVFLCHKDHLVQERMPLSDQFKKIKSKYRRHTRLG